LGICVKASAQFVFDYHLHFDSIVKLSAKSKEELKYEVLLDRFNQADTALRDFDILTLMIAETQQDDYYPYELVHIERRILNYAQNGKDALCLELCDSLLNIHPLNFTALLEKAFVLDKMNLETDARKAEYKFVRYLETILSTGDGTIDYPIMVLSPMDGQILIRFIFGKKIGTMGSGEDKHGNFVDILELIDEEQGGMNMYFNIEHAVKRMFKEDVMKDFEKVLNKEEKKDKKRKSSKGSN
jgi:hypothetical protein